ncbi:MAG: hemolysin family protein, partial [Streptosporangiaceae bacterium]
ALAGLIEPLLEPVGVPAGAADGIALAVGLILAIVIQMILGELLPKNLALAKPETLARALAASTLAYLRIAAPLIRMFDASANRVLRAVGIEPVEELHHGATLEELGHIIGESEQHLNDDHVDLLERALAFSDHQAAEAMVPRIDVVTVPASATAAELGEIIARHGHTHYPVVGDRVDDIIGIIGLRELLPLAPGAQEQALVGSLARPALMIPALLTLPDVFAQMQVWGDEVACVIDEYGGFAGLLTLEDVAEELVGEISDESDQKEPLARNEDGWWHADAGLRIDEIGQATGLDLPEGDYDTAGGLILQSLGRLAEPGDVVRLDDGNGQIDIEVLTIDHHVPERIRLRVAVAAEDPR